MEEKVFDCICFKMAGPASRFSKHARHYVFPFDDMFKKKFTHAIFQDIVVSCVEVNLFEIYKISEDVWSVSCNEPVSCNESSLVGEGVVSIFASMSTCS